MFKQRHSFISTTLSYTRFILYPSYTAIAVSRMHLRTHTETQTHEQHNVCLSAKTEINV